MSEKRPSCACCRSLQFHAAQGWQFPFPLCFVPVTTFSLKGMCLSSGVCVCFHFHSKSTSTLWSFSKMLYHAWSKCQKERPLKKFETPSYLFWAIIYSLWIFLFVTCSYSFRAYIQSVLKGLCHRRAKQVYAFNIIPEKQEVIYVLVVIIHYVPHPYVVIQVPKNECKGRVFALVKLQNNFTS